jgi:hypothetical protein
MNAPSETEDVYLVTAKLARGKQCIASASLKQQMLLPAHMTLKKQQQQAKP